MSGVLISRAVGVAVGQTVDRVCGEPPVPFHPLVHVGNALTRLEQFTYRDSRAAGVVHLLIAGGAAAAGGLLLQRACGPWLATAITVSVASSAKMLGDTALGVATTIGSDDLVAARGELRSLVGRRTEELSVDEMVRAIIESVAENTVDGVTATWFWAIVGGAPAVCVHRVVNTLDAMVGHRNERYARFGWASARLDDVANWIPARLTALAIAGATPSFTKGRFFDVLRVVRRDGAKHPSPNGGRVEAAVAASLGVTLGGPNDYDGTVEVRSELGDGPAPRVTDVRRAVRVTHAASLLLTVGSVAAAVILRATRRRFGNGIRSRGSRASSAAP